MKLFKNLKLLLKKLFYRKDYLYYLSGAETLPNAYSTEEELEKIKELLSGKKGVMLRALLQPSARER